MYKPVAYLSIAGLLNTTACAPMIDNLLSRPREIQEKYPGQSELYIKLNRKIDRMVEESSYIVAEDNVPISTKNVDIVYVNSNRPIRYFLNRQKEEIPKNRIIENAETLIHLLRLADNLNISLDYLVSEIDDGDGVIRQDEVEKFKPYHSSRK